MDGEGPRPCGCVDPPIPGANRPDRTRRRPGRHGRRSGADRRAIRPLPRGPGLRQLATVETDGGRPTRRGTAGRAVQAAVTRIHRAKTANAWSIVSNRPRRVRHLPSDPRLDDRRRGSRGRKNDGAEAVGVGRVSPTRSITRRGLGSGGNSMTLTRRHHGDGREGEPARSRRGRRRCANTPGDPPPPSLEGSPGGSAEPPAGRVTCGTTTGLRGPPGLQPGRWSGGLEADDGPMHDPRDRDAGRERDGGRRTTSGRRRFPRRSSRRPAEDDRTAGGADSGVGSAGVPLGSIRVGAPAKAESPRAPRRTRETIRCRSHRP